MKDAHVTAELLDAVVRFELPPGVLAHLVWEHLRAVCPDCAAGISGWMESSGAGVRRYDDVLKRASSGATVEREKVEPIRVAARRELAEVLRTPADERLVKVERATKRFASPYLAHLLIEEAWGQRKDDPEEARRLALLARAVAKKTGVGELMARAAAHVGNGYRIAGRLQEAHEAFMEVRRLLRRHAVVDPLLFAEVDSLEGSLRRDRNEFEVALKLLSRSHLVYNLRNERKKAALVLHQLGYLYYKQGRLEDSFDTFHRELAILETEGDSAATAAVHRNLVVLYVDAGRPAEARRLLESAREALEAVPGRTFALRTTWVEGRIARHLFEYAEAEAKFSEAAAGFGRLGIGYDAALVSLDLAEALFAQGKTRAVMKLAADVGRLLVANDLKQEAVAAMTLFQNAAEQGLVTDLLLEQVKQRIVRVGRKR